MMTIIIIIASLITDITLGGLAYRIAKAQDKVVKSLGAIAESLDKRVTLLEEAHVVSLNRGSYNAPSGTWNQLPFTFTSTT